MSAPTQTARTGPRNGPRTGPGSPARTATSDIERRNAAAPGGHCAGTRLPEAAMQ